MTLYNTYNNENILSRALLAGLLNILNNEIKYTQVWGNEDIEEIKVPWYYSQDGDERFNQDFYTFYASCMPPRKIDGNMDSLPRGIIKYTGSSIASTRITSRYVQGRYVKEINGQLESYVSFLYSIPLTVRIDCELWVDRHITALKIEQEIRETFYKTKTYYVYYKGMRIGSTVGFPEDITLEKNIQYSFESDNKIKVTFQLEIESYQPVFDKTTETKASSKIKGIGYSLYPMDLSTNRNVISVTSPLEGAIIPKGIPIWVEWSTDDKGRIMNNVNIEWSYYQQNDRHTIQLMEPNHEFFIWNIPENFTTFKEPIMLWEEDTSVSVSRKPIVKIVPDLTTKVIGSSSFKLIDEGYFNAASSDVSMNIQLEMRDDNNVISYTPDGAIWANIRYNVLDPLSPITVSPDASAIVFPGTVDNKHIDIYVSDSGDTYSVGILNNIKIV